MALLFLVCLRQRGGGPSLFFEISPVGWRKKDEIKKWGVGGVGGVWKKKKVKEKEILLKRESENSY